MQGQFIKAVEPLNWAHGPIPCVVAEADLSDALLWQREIQPHIKALPPQVGQSWSWPGLVMGAQGTERMMGRAAMYLQLLVRGNGRMVPIAQMILSVGYPFLADKNLHSAYLWYLAAAPEAYLSNFRIPKIRVLPYLLDTAIQASFQFGFDGRICLHAASSGTNYDAALFSKYVQAGLKPLPASMPLRITKRNDGRYFVCDNRDALALSAKLDYFR